MDWLVFGDDWKAHASTTVHLIEALPPQDRVIWVNSIAMRAPQFNLQDARRAMQKVGALLQPTTSQTPVRAKPHQRVQEDRVTVVAPAVLPWHLQSGVRKLNTQLLSAKLRDVMQRLEVSEVTALAANPVSALYLDALPIRRLAYLRLDDYAALPGVDPKLAHYTEAAMFERMDLGFATAHALVPKSGPGAERPWTYLPQGVDLQHFSLTPNAPPSTRVIGFFGLMAEWLDYDFILAVVRKFRDWQFEFLGPVRYVPETLAQEANVKMVPKVPYDVLPEHIGHWRGAWLPFELSTLTEAVNPVKIREYLAAGLPTFSTPLPEVVGLPEVSAAHSIEGVGHWLHDDVEQDTVLRRAARRQAVMGDSWDARAKTLRSVMT